MESGAGVVAVCCGIAESTTCGVNENTPDVVGVPLIWPEAVFSTSPGGSLPEAIDHVRGGTPPELTMEAVYAEFTVAPSKAPLELIESGGGALMRIVY